MGQNVTLDTQYCNITGENFTVRNGTLEIKSGSHASFNSLAIGDGGQVTVDNGGSLSADSITCKGGNANIAGGYLYVSGTADARTINVTDYGSITSGLGSRISVGNDFSVNSREKTELNGEL